MNRIITLLIFLVLLFSCKPGPKNKTVQNQKHEPQITVSKLEKLKNDGLIIVDTIIGNYSNPNYTARIDLKNIELYLINYYSDLTLEFNLEEFILYDGTNNIELIAPDIKVVSYELNNIQPTPEFTVGAWLPDSIWNFGYHDFIKQSLEIANGIVEIKNELIYSPPHISVNELDSLILQFENRPLLNEISRDTVGVIDEMYFIKMFVASIQGNKKCEHILYNLTDKFGTDGSIAESHYDFIYLDKLLKNKK